MTRFHSFRPLHLRGKVISGPKARCNVRCPKGCQNAKPHLHRLMLWWFKLCRHGAFLPVVYVMCVPRLIQVSAVPIYSRKAFTASAIASAQTKSIEVTMRVNHLLSDGYAETSGSHFSDGMISSATSWPTARDKIQCSCRTPSVKEAGPG